jgi:hypothetical protein
VIKNNRKAPFRKGVGSNPTVVTHFLWCVDVSRNHRFLASAQADAVTSLPAGVECKVPVDMPSSRQVAKALEFGNEFTGDIRILATFLSTIYYVTQRLLAHVHALRVSKEPSVH